MKDEHIPTYIFQMFIQTVVPVARKNKMSEQDVGELLSELKKYTYEMRLPIDKKKYLNNLFSFKEEGAGDLVQLDVEHLKAMTQLVYEFLCGTIGSVYTDRIFSISLQKTADLPEALSFSPQKLLR